MNMTLDFLLKRAGLESETVRSRVQAFYQQLQRENEIQNLTRLISGEDFLNGHVLDVLELLNLGWVEFPALDMGSGGGIPGLLAAAIQESQWILCDSEKRKAEYLFRVVSELGLNDSVQVFSGRAEDYLKNHSVKSVVARAVGPVDRLYSWIRKCSTWNTLILLKGPSWEVEWKRFQKNRWSDELKLRDEYSYSVGPEAKRRRIIRLDRRI